MRLVLSFLGVTLLLALVACGSESRIVGKADQLWDCFEENPGYLQYLRNASPPEASTMWGSRNYFVGAIQHQIDLPIEESGAERAERLEYTEAALDNWMDTCESTHTVQ